MFAQARQYASDRMQRELPSYLAYHGLAHTRDEVVPAVETFAGLEGIQGEYLHLLLTAAWFHDLGHVEQAANHEAIGARIAAEVLPSFGYAANQVEIVRGAILATVLPQSPRSGLEEILADADLDVLGRENFMQRNSDLRRELVSLGREFTDEQWYSSQLGFLEKHTYFTASARLLRNAQKKRNTDEIRTKLQFVTQSSKFLGDSR
jgi:predicted metal-dependent HD superfamily phosphohydrolase